MKSMRGRPSENLRRLDYNTGYQDSITRSGPLSHDQLLMGQVKTEQGVSETTVTDMHISTEFCVN